MDLMIKIQLSTKQLILLNTTWTKCNLNPYIPVTFKTKEVGKNYSYTTVILGILKLLNLNIIKITIHSNQQN